MPFPPENSPLYTLTLQPPHMRTHTKTHARTRGGMVFEDGILVGRAPICILEHLTLKISTSPRTITSLRRATSVSRKLREALYGVGPGETCKIRNLTGLRQLRVPSQKPLRDTSVSSRGVLKASISNSVAMAKREAQNGVAIHAR